MKMALTRIGKEKIRQLTPITEGGEGYIYEFGNDILKIYKPCVDIAAKEKKVAMLIDKPLPKEAIKPITAVYDNNNKFIGYIMPKAVGEEVRVLTSKKYLKANGITTKDILEILVKIQDTVRDIHSAGVCIGDLNDQNILFDKTGNVYFIDCDSWSVEDEKCEVCMDLFKDPLMKGNDFSEETDTYAEAILIWKTLTRIHPHGGTMTPDMDIVERMKRGICVIDNPKVKIPRTIKPWKNLSPYLVDSLKKIYENKSRSMGDELKHMAKHLKFCDVHQEFYYGKYARCPLCDNNANVLTKPVSQGVTGGLTLITMLKGNDVKIVLNEQCYINNAGEVVEVKNGNKFTYESGIKYHFAEVGAENIVIKADDRAFWFTTDREYVFEKKHKSPIYAAGDSVYFISPANTLTSIQITKSGNGIRTITKCGYESYFAVSEGHSCVVSRFAENLIVNLDGKNIEIPYTDTVNNYGIHRDKITGGWLIVLENGAGQFFTFVCNEHGVAYSEDRIKYQCRLGNVCFYNSNISIPIDGNIRIYSYQKQAFKDFECEAVSPDSCLIKDSTSFTIVNDENIYRLVRTVR